MTTRSTLLLSAITVLLVACDAPVVGEWESDRLGNDEKNELFAYSDLTGEATIWVTPKDDLDNWIKFKFDLIWEDEGTEFDFEFECDSKSCSSDDDFKMECEVVEPDDNTEDRLDCKSKNSRWKSYPLQWEREG